MRSPTLYSPCRLAALLLALVLAGPAAAQTPVLAVVVPTARAAEPLDRDAIARIYKRRQQLWRDGRRIQPVNLPADHPWRRRFSQAVLDAAPEALDGYWTEQYYHGIRPPHVLASEAAVARFVAETPTAIGYLPYCGLESGLRPVLLIAADGSLLAPDAAPACP